MKRAELRNPNRKRSSRLLRKGVLIPETYSLFQHWDYDLPESENYRRLKELNPMGAPNRNWAREVVATISSRFPSVEAVRPLIHLAQCGFPLDKWRLCLFWHVGQTDELYYRFAQEWLYPQYASGAFILRTDDVVPFVRGLFYHTGDDSTTISEYGMIRAARDLLRMAADFGLLAGRNAKQFVTVHLPDDCFLYILQALSERQHNADRVIHSPDWQLFLMQPAEVERELLRLHQYRKLHYEVAGSLSQLRLPCHSLMEYVQEMTK